MHATVLLRPNHHRKCKVPSFTHSKDMIREQKFLMAHVTLTTPIRRQFVIPRLTIIL